MTQANTLSAGAAAIVLSLGVAGPRDDTKGAANSLPNLLLAHIAGDDGEGVGIGRVGAGVCHKANAFALVRNLQPSCRCSRRSSCARPLSAQIPFERMPALT